VDHRRPEPAIGRSAADRISLDSDGTDSLPYELEIRTHRSEAAMLKISPNAKISPMADIEDSIRGGNIIIEDGVAIDSFVKIKPAGGDGDVVIGKNCTINSGVVIYTGNGVKIGANVAIGANTTIAPTNHEHRSGDTLIRDQRFMPSRGGVVIEEDVWIAANVVLLDGAHLGKGCVVGAGSLVRGKLEPYSINVGTPTRAIGYRETDQLGAKTAVGS
jgi:acetyltransferase-like isoleucine patch superfamily enzyme